MTPRAVSLERYRATATQRRLYGGRTVTEFAVGPYPGGREYRVTGYGPTPGQRATDAIRRGWEQHAADEAARDGVSP